MGELAGDDKHRIIKRENRKENSRNQTGLSFGTNGITATITERNG